MWFGPCFTCFTLRFTVSQGSYDGCHYVSRYYSTTLEVTPTFEVNLLNCDLLLSAEQDSVERRDWTQGRISYFYHTRFIENYCHKSVVQECDFEFFFVL